MGLACGGKIKITIEPVGIKGGKKIIEKKNEFVWKVQTSGNSVITDLDTKTDWNKLILEPYKKLSW